MLQVSVVIATYNRSRLLFRCLQSLAAQEYPKESYELIVVDDGSNDDTEDVVLRFSERAPLPRVRYRKLPHMGPSKARNFGIEQSSGEIVAFIDDDAYAKRDWLRILMGRFEENNIKAVEGAVLNTENKVLPFCHYVENRRGGQYLTANMAFRREILKIVGMFDTQFRFAHAEDKELACRVIKAGGKIAFCDHAVVYHPAREITYEKAVQEWRRYGDFLRLYRVHPDLFKLMTGRRLPFFLLDTVFLVPMVDIRQWIRGLRTMRLRFRLLFFSFSKALVNGLQVILNLNSLWKGYKRIRKNGLYRRRLDLPVH